VIATAVERDLGMAKRLSACGGTYLRGVDGVWRYWWGEEVPGAADVYDRGRLISIMAPELCPELLVDAKSVMEHFDWSERSGTLSTYLSRGWFPRPVVKVGQCNAWTWPVIRHYERTRPWRDGRPAGQGPQDARSG
jgi:hypothetical protein